MVNRKRGNFVQPYRMEIVAVDGTVDLLNGPFFVKDWPISVAGYKGGGTFQSSSLADGRRLVDRRFTNVTQNISLNLRASNVDAAIRALQNLRRALEACANYHVRPENNTPCYLLVQARRETNIRYAIIEKGSLPEDQFVFGNIWNQATGRVAADDLPLIIEHRIWQSTVPGGQGDTVEIAGYNTYNSEFFGNQDVSGTKEAVTDATAFVSPRRSNMNITNSYGFDASGPSWSANEVGAVPYDLFNNTVSVSGDLHVFGVDTSLSNSGPFNGLVFDLSVGGLGISVTWEYWNGAAWSALTVVDETGGLQQTNVNTVTWNVPIDWATGDLNTIFGGTAPSVTGYWVRARVTAGGPGRVTQQNRNVYCVSWGWVEIDNGQTGGDIPTYLEIYGNCQSDDESNDPSAALAPSGAAEAMYIGARTKARGDSFTAFLNAADEQNPTGVTVAVGSDTTFLTRTYSPTGRVAHYNPVSAPDPMADRVTFTLDNTIADEFYGRFRAFCRIEIPSGTTNAFEMEAQVRAFNTTFTTPIGVPKYTVGTPRYGQLVDFGEITLPPSNITLASETPDELVIALRASASDASIDLYIYDLILLPVDEWACRIDTLEDGVVGSPILNTNNSVRVDSIQNARRTIRTLVMDTQAAAAGNVEYVWQTSAPGPVQMRRSGTQRFYFLPVQRDVSASSEVVDRVNYNAVFGVRVFKSQRYLSGRGDR